jgi:hypothetical protein
MIHNDVGDRELPVTNIIPKSGKPRVNHNAVCPAHPRFPINRNICPFLLRYQNDLFQFILCFF